MPFSRYPSGSCPCQVSLPFELRHFPAGSLSPLSRIEFVSYRLVVLLRLLPTPPHDDAVAVEYGPENVCPVGTFTLLFKCAYERTGSRFHAANCSDHGGSSHIEVTLFGPRRVLPHYAPPFSSSPSPSPASSGLPARERASSRTSSVMLSSRPMSRALRTMKAKTAARTKR